MRCLVAANGVFLAGYHFSCIMCHKTTFLYRSLWDFIFYMNNFGLFDIFLSHVSSKMKSNESNGSRYRRDPSLVASCSTP